MQLTFSEHIGCDTGRTAAGGLKVIALISLFSFFANGQTPSAPQSQGTAARTLSPPSQATYVPLTKQERWHRYLGKLVSPAAVVTSAASAGISQWTDTPGEWQEGATGYGYRFANSYGKYLVYQSLQSGAAALLNEDTRYVPSGESGFGPRLKYALTSTVTARSRNGSRRVAFSTIGALVGTAFISRTWQPSSNSHPQNAMSSLGVSVGVAAGFNVAHEFLPRVFHLWGLWR